METVIAVKENVFSEKVTQMLNDITITIPEGMKEGDTLRFDDLSLETDTDLSMVIDLEIRLTDLLNDCGGDSYRTEKID